jgi:ankyrin repeat protein
VGTDWERAALDNDTSSLRQMLDVGADIDAVNRYGQTALMIAAHHGHRAAVETLVRRGAALDATAKHGLSALMLAVVAGHESIARRLAEAGADLTLTGVGAPGFAGKSAYDLAVARGLVDLAAVLRVDGSDVPGPGR